MESSVPYGNRNVRVFKINIKQKTKMKKAPHGINAKSTYTTSPEDLKQTLEKLKEIGVYGEQDYLNQEADGISEDGYNAAGLFSKSKADQLAKQFNSKVERDPSGKYLVLLSSGSFKKEEPKIWYQVEYYDNQGGHGSLGDSSSDFQSEYIKAVDLYKLEKKAGELGKSTGYIGVNGSGDKFAIVYMDQAYFDNMSENDFKNKIVYENYMKVAKKVLKTGKPLSGSYGEKFADGGMVSKRGMEVWVEVGQNNKDYYFSVESYKKEVDKLISEGYTLSKQSKPYLQIFTKQGTSKGKEFELKSLLKDGSTIISNGANGYICFYKGKQMEVHANTSLEARNKAAISFKATKKPWEVTAVLAEKGGEQVTHVAEFEQGATIESENTLINKIERTIKEIIPFFYISVKPYKSFSGSEKIAIEVAASNYEINKVRGQYPQCVSLLLDEKTFELHPQIFGGNGGQTIYREVNKEDPKEKFYAMIGIKIPFRKPKPNEEAVLKAIEKFFENYRKAIEDNIETIRYKDVVDYKEVLKNKLEQGATIESNYQTAYDTSNVSKPDLKKALTYLSTKQVPHEYDEEQNEVSFDSESLKPEHESYLHKLLGGIKKFKEGGNIADDNWVGKQVRFQGKDFIVKKRVKDGVYDLKTVKGGLFGGGEMIATEEELKTRFIVVPKFKEGGTLTEEQQNELSELIAEQADLQKSLKEVEEDSEEFSQIEDEISVVNEKIEKLSTVTPPKEEDLLEELYEGKSTLLSIVREYAGDFVTKEQLYAVVQKLWDSAIDYPKDFYVAGAMDQSQESVFEKAEELSRYIGDLEEENLFSDEEEVQSIIRALIMCASSKENKEEESTLQNWGIYLTEEEVDLIVSAVNRYGTHDHPVLNRGNWKRLSVEYVKEVMSNEQFENNLSKEGELTRTSLLRKLNKI